MGNGNEDTKANEKKPITFYKKRKRRAKLLKRNAGGGNRTRTPLTGRGILSPLSLKMIRIFFICNDYS